MSNLTRNKLKIVLISLGLSFVATAKVFPPKAMDKNRLAVATTKSEALVSNKKVNLNKVNAKALSKAVKGIGPKRAEAIINYREQYGKFKSLEDLSLVKGISKRFIQKNWQYLNQVLSLK